MMTGAVRGRTRGEAEELSRAFERLISAAGAQAGADGQGIDLGDLVAFAGVRRYPVRVKCARLPWQTLMAALGGATSTVSTE
jgi:nitrogen fixation NifU-like protein